MKKAELKGKSSKTKTVTPVSNKPVQSASKKGSLSPVVSVKKTEKPATTPLGPDAKSSIIKSSASPPAKDRTTKTKVNTKSIPKAQPKRGKSSAPAAAPKSATSRSGRDKSIKSNKSKSNKLVQVVPTHKPSFKATAPVKREKMLMRFGKPTNRVLFTVDFLLKASPTILYHFITTPSCLVRWFCDAVDITGEYFTFSWNGSIEVAELLDDIEDERLRFRWLDGEDEDEYFEFRISTADITDETILEIVDFAWADEVEEQKTLWRTQVDKLRKETGDA